MLTQFTLIKDFKTIWLNPAEVVAVSDLEHGSDTCEVEMKSGTFYHLRGNKDAIAGIVNSVECKPLEAAWANSGPYPGSPPIRYKDAGPQTESSAKDLPDPHKINADIL